MDVASRSEIFNIKLNADELITLSHGKKRIAPKKYAARSRIVLLLVK